MTDLRIRTIVSVKAESMQSINRRLGCKLALGSLLLGCFYRTGMCSAEPLTDANRSQLSSFLIDRSNPLFSCNGYQSVTYSVAEVLRFATSSPERARLFDISSQSQMKIIDRLAAFEENQLRKLSELKKSFHDEVLNEAFSLVSNISKNRIGEAIFCCDGLASCCRNTKNNPAYLGRIVADRIDVLTKEYWERYARSYVAQFYFGRAGLVPTSIYFMKATRNDVTYSLDALKILDDNSVATLNQLQQRSQWFVRHLEALISITTKNLLGD